MAEEEQTLPEENANEEVAPPPPADTLDAEPQPETTPDIINKEASLIEASNVDHSNAAPDDAQGKEEKLATIVEGEKPVEEEQIPEEEQKTEEELKPKEESTPIEKDKNQEPDEGKILDVRKSLDEEPDRAKKSSVDSKRVSIGTDKHDKDQRKSDEDRLNELLSAMRRHSSGKSLDHTSSLNEKARQVLGSVISIRKSSLVGDVIDRKAARYLNSYRLDSEKPFNPESVQKILQSVLIEAVEGPYDEIKCPAKAKWASAAIRAKVKLLEYDRYKLVTVVTIGEKLSQDVSLKCRFLWDCERDKYAVFSHETSQMFGVAMCFGLYYE